jgi:hypothetical protein
MVTHRYHAVVARLVRETERAYFLDIVHPDYGVLINACVPKSVIDETSLEMLSQLDETEATEIFIRSWWFHKNYGD